MTNMHAIKQELLRPEFVLDWTSPREIPSISYYDYFYTNNPIFSTLSEYESLESNPWKRKREPESLFDLIETIDSRPFKRTRSDYDEEYEEAKFNLTREEYAPFTGKNEDGESLSCYESPRSVDSAEVNSSTDLANDQGSEEGFLTPNPAVWESLKNALTKYKIYQKDLANDIKVSASTVSAYLTRKARLNGWTSFEDKIEDWLAVARKAPRLNFVNCSYPATSESS